MQLNKCTGAFASVLLSVSCLAAPPLPEGLNTTPSQDVKKKPSPPLPAGLNSIPAEKATDTKAPTLPAGLSETAEPSDSQYEQVVDSTEEPWVHVTGFWDTRGGIRTQDDPNQDRFSLGETRLQLALEKEIGPVNINIVSDFLYDSQAQSYNINLNTGQGWIDLREGNIAFSPFSFVDFKIGRQILTWGTGDLIFINDLFPKDWQAFFIGRDVEYLKAPSDAVKASFFSKWANLDIVFTPQFDADRFISGERISYYNPQLGEIAGNNAVITTDRPDAAEWSLRLYKTLGVNEIAFYGYNGFWKSPARFDPNTGNATYPDLSVIGASIRRPVYKGIASFEMGYYLSSDANNGNNPLVQNSEARFLVGYEQELVKNVSIGFQYYLEWMQDYQNYLNTLPGGVPARDETRHVLTNRITWLTLNQNLIWSLFTYFSPSDLDAYFRPLVQYKITDSWSTELGGNFFVGDQEHTFFGQFEQNNNVYAAFRYGF